MLDDDAACELWESLGMFVRPEMREGDDGITAVILKTIVDDAESSTGSTQNSGDLLEQFLSKLDKIFSQAASINLYEARDYIGAYSVWGGLVEQEYFDPRHPNIADKPYYRALTTSAICQCLIACIQAINSGQISNNDNAFASELNAWVDRVLDLCLRLSEIEPLDVSEAGYFKQYSEGVYAQNHNVWVSLNALTDWFNGWSPRVLSSFSVMQESEIEKVVDMILEKESVFRASDR